MSRMKHMVVSYVPKEDSLSEETKEYENIINFIAKYLHEKDYHYMIARESVINERLKQNTINYRGMDKIAEEICREE